MKKRQGGFTLMELLTVIAIVSVLVGVAIPLFTGREERVQSSACETNCRSIKAELDLGVLLDGDDPAEVFRQIKQGYVCPSGGNYILDYDRISGSISVWCTIHSKALSFSPDFLNAIPDALREGNGDIALRTNLDSEYADKDTDANALKLINSLASKGFDLSGAMWRLSGGSYDNPQSFFWTTADPEVLKPGDTVLVIKYNFSTFSNEAYRGCYSVYTCKVASTINNNYTYNVLDTTGSLSKQQIKELPESKGISTVGKKDFNTLMDIYNKAVADNGGSPVISN